MSVAVVEFEVTQGDWAEAMLLTMCRGKYLSLLRRSAIKSWLIASVPAAMLAAVFGWTGTFSSQGGPRMAAFCAGGVLAVLPFVLVYQTRTKHLIRRLESSTRRAIARGMFDLLDGPCRVAVEADGLDVSYSTSTSRYPWGSASGARVTPDALIVEFEHNVVRVPRRAFSEQTEFDAFCDAVSERLAAHGKPGIGGE